METLYKVVTIDTVDDQEYTQEEFLTSTEAESIRAKLVGDIDGQYRVIVKAHSEQEVTDFIKSLE